MRIILTVILLTLAACESNPKLDAALLGAAAGFQPPNWSTPNCVPQRISGIVTCR